MTLSGMGANLGACVRRYLRSESGVVTVEWVAIAAGVTIGAIYVTYIVMHGLVAPANHIASQLAG
jgi:Flp pilus assembly pilin Flp